MSLSFSLSLSLSLSPLSLSTSFHLDCFRSYRNSHTPFLSIKLQNENETIFRGKTEYENFKGTGYAQVAISTKDVYKTAEQIRAAGGAITREPGPVPGIGTKICATTDPDGWKVVFVDEADFLEELR